MGHVILVVEDDDEVANVITAKLQACGHTCLRARTLEEVIAAAAAGGFCAVVTDLALPAKHGLSAQTESGQCGIEEIRRVFPRRNDLKKCHHLPILVVSMHADEAPELRQAFKSGIDDAIQKPISRANPPLKVVLDALLVNSARTDHEKDCDVADKLARGLRPAGVEKTPGPSNGKVTLGVTGTKSRRRSHVVIDGKPVKLKPQAFEMILRLVRTRLKGVDEFIMLHELAPGTTGHKPTSRLMQDFVAFLPDEMKIYDNDEEGGYRLHPDVELGEIDFDALERHSEIVKSLAKEIRGLNEKRKRA